MFIIYAHFLLSDKLGIGLAPRLTFIFHLYAQQFTSPFNERASLESDAFVRFENLARFRCVRE